MKVEYLGNQVGLHYLCTMNQAIDFIEVVVNAKEQTRRKIESLINELKP